MRAPSPIVAPLQAQDSDRAGGFEPLRFLPKGKHVVLGLVTSKTGVLEAKDDIRRRIDEIAGTQEVRPDLPAMAAEKPRSAADIAKAPSFNDMLAALPRDPNGDPDLAPLVERIASYGTNAWGRLTPEQRASIAQLVETFARSNGPQQSSE